MAAGVQGHTGRTPRTGQTHKFRRLLVTPLAGRLRRWWSGEIDTISLTPPPDDVAVLTSGRTYLGTLQHVLRVLRRAQRVRRTPKRRGCGGDVPGCASSAEFDARGLAAAVVVYSARPRLCCRGLEQVQRDGRTAPKEHIRRHISVSASRRPRGLLTRARHQQQRRPNAQ